jgi:hypothetical protein
MKARPGNSAHAAHAEAANDSNAPAVAIRHLNFAYNEGQPVLHDLSLRSAGRFRRHRRPHGQRQIDPAVAAAALLSGAAGQHHGARRAARCDRQ